MKFAILIGATFANEVTIHATADCATECAALAASSKCCPYTGDGGTNLACVPTTLFNTAIWPADGYSDLTNGTAFGTGSEPDCTLPPVTGEGPCAGDAACAIGSATNAICCSAKEVNGNGLESAADVCVLSADQGK